MQQVTEDLRSRHDLDDVDLRALGARLSDARRAENLEFAERFTSEHHETFDRLSK